jgi:hypothetical protein
MAKRKTFKKKASAKRAAHGKSVYKVKGGYRLAKKKGKRKSRRRKTSSTCSSHGRGLRSCKRGSLFG